MTTSRILPKQNANVKLDSTELPISARGSASAWVSRAAVPPFLSYILKDGSGRARDYFIGKDLMMKMRITRWHGAILAGRVKLLGYGFKELPFPLVKYNSY